MFTEYFLISCHKKGTRHTKGISHQGLKTVLGHTTNLKIEQNTCPGEGIALRKGTDRKFLIQVGWNTSWRMAIRRRLRRVLRADKTNNNETTNWNNSIRSSWMEKKLFVEANFKCSWKLGRCCWGPDFWTVVKKTLLANLIGQSGFVCSVR